jgi:hypothetical protein
MGARRPPRSPRRRWCVRVIAGAAVVAALCCFANPAYGQDAPPPRILLDQSARAVEYQLGRLSDDQLARVERRADDPRYVPVYYALLTRAAMADAVREEAITALVVLEKATRTAVLLQALRRVDAPPRAAPLLRLLLAQAPADLAGARAQLAAAIAGAEPTPFVLQGAYAALLLGDRSAAATWGAAGTREGHRAALLLGLSSLPASADADALRRDLAPRVAAVLAAPATEDEYVAAVAAVAATRRDGEAFRLLADVVARGRTAAAVAAAVDGLGLIPEREWPAGDVEPLVKAVITRVTALSPDERTGRDAIDAIGLAERLAGVLPADRARSLRADLRALGVWVVRIEARPEQVAFDLRWFVVEAGKPVQIVFFNPDAMPHNVVIGAPGSLERLGTEGGAMPVPTDPSVKAFVPDLPQVLQATRLVTQGQTERLGFIAPADPGEYVFVCTFPGHWVRMYGVMLVVPDLDAWEAKPTVPVDPMTKQPFASQRTE